jgi:hypothetical protein
MHWGMNSRPEGMMKLKCNWIAGEPDLHDMLDDDVVLAVMDRDGVSRRDLVELISRVQRRLNGSRGSERLLRRLPTPANDMAPRARL